MDKYLIYSLEFNGDIFYVGKTTNPKHRLNKHRKESIYKRTHKEKMINKILSNGGDITLSILDIVNIGEEDYWEKYWISQIKCWGIKLYNGTNGGEGGDHWTGKSHTEETKLKLREIRYKQIEKNGVTRCPGSKNGRSKLKEDDVLEIRKLKNSGYSYGKLSLKYNVSKTAIIRVVKRKSWQHI